MSIIFGLATFAKAVTGLRLQSVTYGETASTAEAMDENGAIEQIDIYGKKKTIQAEGNVVEGGDLKALTIGASLTVSGDTFIIDSVSIKETNTGHKTCSLSGVAPMAAATGG